MAINIPIEQGKIYHLYNHANGNLQLFRNDENYRYFLSKYVQYVHPFVDTYAYCLMPNHFHFAIKIKEEMRYEVFGNNKQRINEKSSDLFKRSELYTDEYTKRSEVSETSDLYKKSITNGIKNWLISYTQAYHKAYSTRGNLYHQKIRRKIVSDNNYLLSLIGYIHLNPIHHKFVSKPDEWKYSSYTAFFSGKETLVKRDEILYYFENSGNFQFYHEIQNTEKFGLEMELSY